MDTKNKMKKKTSYNLERHGKPFNQSSPIKKHKFKILNPMQLNSQILQRHTFITIQNSKGV